MFESQVDDACEKISHAPQLVLRWQDAHLAIRGACCQTRLLSTVGLESLSLTSARGIPWRTSWMRIMTLSAEVASLAQGYLRFCQSSCSVKRSPGNERRPTLFCLV